MRGVKPYLLCLLLGCLCGGVRADDWPQFRGPQRTGISAEEAAPRQWSRQRSVLWRVPLPRPGNSSPIVVGDRIFLTCAEDARGHKRSLYCFERASGRTLWVRTVEYAPVEPTHNTNPYCASTPAADKDRVYVWHGSAGFFCYDHAGKELWTRDLGAFRHIWGYASSPILVGRLVILNCGPGPRSFIIAMDKATGQPQWQYDIPGGADDKGPDGKWVGSFSTPIVARVGEQDQVIAHLSRKMVGLDAQSGKEIWSAGGLGDLSYTDPHLHGDLVAGFSGFQGAAVAVRLGTGDLTNARLWRVTTKNPQRIGTGAVFDGKLYAPAEGSIQCIDLKTGDELWNHRIPGQTFWSPVLATRNGIIYFTSQKGTTYVVRADAKEFALLHSNDLGEPSNSAPALSNGQLFIRTHSALYCIQE